MNVVDKFNNSIGDTNQRLKTQRHDDWIEEEEKYSQKSEEKNVKNVRKKKRDWIETIVYCDDSYIMMREFNGSKPKKKKKSHWMKKMMAYTMILYITCII